MKNRIIKSYKNNWNHNQDKNYISLQFYNNDQLIITGPYEVFTLQLKTLLKKLGFNYQSAYKGWMMPYKDYKQNLALIK
jgi:hypothetical protein